MALLQSRGSPAPPGVRNSWHVSRRPLAGRGVELTAINWETVHVDDLVSKRVLLEPSGGHDKFEFRVKETSVGYRVYNLGFCLWPKEKTDL